MPPSINSSRASKTDCLFHLLTTYGVIAQVSFRCLTDLCTFGGTKGPYFRHAPHRRRASLCHLYYFPQQHCPMASGTLVSPVSDCISCIAYSSRRVNQKEEADYRMLVVSVASERMPDPDKRLRICARCRSSHLG